MFDHIGFSTPDMQKLREFYDKALATLGITCLMEVTAEMTGGDGLRPQYHPDYYGAFVLDPDGHNIEAVCH